MNRRWICSDVWMDILPSFDHAQLGLKLALLSDRFDVLVDTHFDGKSELTIWRQITICEGIGPRSKLSVRIDDNWVDFQLPDHSLPNKIRFKHLRISYIDDSLITFLHANKQIWDRSGTELTLAVFSCENEDVQPIWDVVISEIWPIFAPNIRQLRFAGGDYLDKLRRHISPTILTDLDQLNSIDSEDLWPDAIADDGPNATAGQALSKWLHTPTKNSQPKRLICCNDTSKTKRMINNFKEAFLCATTSVAYNVRLKHRFASEMSFVEPFNLVNGRTNERLTLEKEGNYCLLKRCPNGPNVGETAAAVQWENGGNSDANLNNVIIILDGVECIWPLSALEEEEAGQSSEKGTSSDK